MNTISEITAWTQQTMDIITLHVVTPLLIIFIGVIVGKVIGNITYRVCMSIELDKHLRKALNYRGKYSELVAGGISAMIYTIAVIWALVSANIISWALSAVGIFLGVLLLLALFLWTKDGLSNMFARGYVIRNVHMGKSLNIQGTAGKVQSITGTGVRIQTAKKEIIIIPHRTIRATLKRSRASR